MMSATPNDLSPAKFNVIDGENARASGQLKTRSEPIVSDLPRTKGSGCEHVPSLVETRDLQHIAMTKKEVCREGRIGLTTFHKEINEGRLVAWHRGRRTFVWRDEFLRWLHAVEPMNGRGSGGR